MLRSASFVALLGAASGLVLLPARQAAACGGCFHPPTQVASDITDERMLLSVSPTQTTLYDQIRYAGSPASFAWVLPIHGTIDVGLSADVLFDSVDVLTATQIPGPESSCPAGPSCSSGISCGGDDSTTVNAGAAGPPSVTVTKQANVGPYETVQLHATDSSALDAWLAQNGFVIPSDVTPVIDQYVSEGFDFLAMKLLPDQGVQAMRPVRVSSPGASLSLPLRMAAVGTGVTVGITIWVVSDGRYEPQNFPFFHIDDSALVWDWKTSSSNYTTLRAQNESGAMNKSWEIESSIELNQQLVANVILAGGQYYSGFGGGGNPGQPVSADEDYLPVAAPSQADGGSDAGGEPAQTPVDVRAADISTLFAGITGPNARVTRIRSDIAHAAMTVDLLLQASADQSEVSNVRTVTQSVNEQCPVYDGCKYVGMGTPAQARAGQQGGCATSTRGTADRTVGLGTVAGVAALLLARARRSRRRAPRG